MKIKKYFKKDLKCFLFIWLAFTFFALLDISVFKIDSYLDHPQFRVWSDFESFLQIIKESDKCISFILFFVLDMFWALTLFLLLIKILFDFKRKINFRKKKIFMYVFAIMLFITFLFDLTEGILYLISFSEDRLLSALPFIVSIKTMSYGISGLFFLISLFVFSRKHKKYMKIKNGALLFLRTCALSLFVIFLILILFNFVGQGRNILVDMYFNTGNFILIFFLLGFLSVLLSHYPAYFEAKKINKKNTELIEWQIGSGFHVLGLGFIYYIKDSKNKTFNKYTRFLRHQLGTAIIATMISALAYSGDSIYDSFLFNSRLGFVIFSAGVYVYNIFLNRKKMFVEKNEPLHDLKYFWYSIISLSVVFLVTTIVVQFFKWSEVALYMTILLYINLVLTYILFRIYRYEILKKIIKHDDSVNLRFIQFIGVASWIFAVVLILANFFPVMAETFLNPLTIILLYIVVYYELISVLIKHVQFYNETDGSMPDAVKKIHQRYRFHRLLIPVIPVFLIGLLMYSTSTNNGLHDLPRVKESRKEVLTYSELKNEIRLDDSKNIMIAAYGGGLKANLWTMLVLNELQRQSDNQILDRAINISANSGGTIGTANYSNLLLFNSNQSDDHNFLRRKITEIGNFNHLSIDLSMMLGSDLWNELLPKALIRDRSFYAMKRYAEMTGDQETITISKRTFRENYSEIKKAFPKYPSLSFSTISVSGRPGNSFSHQVDKDYYMSLFNRTQNILDLDTIHDSSLTYYDAVSTSNRFPILSPTASIPGEGHFLDGGYFDNSGLSNSLGLYLDIFKKIDNQEQDSTLYNRKIDYIIINSGKSEYIDHLLKKWRNAERDISGVGEFLAVLNTLVNIDKTPPFFEEVVTKIDQDPTHIFLPHYLSYKDVVDHFKGVPKSDMLEIMAIVNANNSTIEKALQSSPNYDLKWGRVETPLARILSAPGVEYQRAMVLYHPGVREAIEGI